MRGSGESEPPPGSRAAVLARNLKRVRGERGIKLSALAADSGVARATLYQLEAGEGNPTIDTLWAVSNALKIPLSELVAEEEPPVLQVIRADEGPRMVGESGVTRLIRRFGSGAGMLEVYELRIDPGGTIQGHAHPAGVLEHVLVAEGRLATGPGDHEVELGPGDYLSFGADGPHRYAAVAGHAVVATLIMDYPPAMDVRSGGR